MISQFKRGDLPKQNRLLPATALTQSHKSLVHQSPVLRFAICLSSHLTFKLWSPNFHVLYIVYLDVDSHLHFYFWQQRVQRVSRQQQ